MKLHTFDVIIFDFSIICYRAFFSTTLSIRTQDQKRIGTAMPVGVIKSFLKTAPQYSHEGTKIVFAIDEYPQRKKLIYPEYKHGRKSQYDAATLEDMKAQLKLTKEIITHLPMITSRKIGEESDDVIATICYKHFRNERILIVSGDKDLNQLLSDRVNILGGKDGNQLCNDAIFTGRFKIAPERFADVQTLAGDDGDNVKGIVGIGFDGALKLVQSYPEVVDDLIADRADFSRVPNRIKTALFKCDYKKILKMTRKLVKLERDLGFVKHRHHRLKMDNLVKALEELKCYSTIEEMKRNEWLIARSY